LLVERGGDRPIDERRTGDEFDLVAVGEGELMRADPNLSGAGTGAREERSNARAERCGVEGHGWD
jgi:hypothetical protein